jgi:hypothetical protein
MHITLINGYGGNKEYQYGYMEAVKNINIYDFKRYNHCDTKLVPYMLLSFSYKFIKYLT